MSDTPGKLRLGALVALVVGSMIGGGIFLCPKTWLQVPMWALFLSGGQSLR